MIRVGLIGCGGIAVTRHLPTFMEFRDVAKVVAVCDKDLSRAKAIAGQYSIAKMFDDPNRLILDKDIDMVDICTPQNTHMEIAIRALEFGHHVLVEKPMALSVKECDRMIRAEAKSGRKLCVIHQMLFYPNVKAALRMVHNRELGDLVSISVDFNTPYLLDKYHRNHWIHSLPGGLISEVGPHEIYLALSFLGNIESIQVLATGESKFDFTPFTHYDIILQSKQSVSTICVGTRPPMEAQVMKIFCQRGMLDLDLFGMTSLRFQKIETNPISVAISNIKQAVTIMKQTFFNAVRYGILKKLWGHREVIKLFLSSIENDTVPPVCSTEGRNTVALLERIVKKLDKSI